MGERALTKFLFGMETVRGTAVAADTLLLAGQLPPILPDRQPTLVNDDAGVRAASVREEPRIDQLLVDDSITLPDTYFQILPAFFSIGLKGSITPVEQTPAEGDFLWTMTPSFTAVNTPDSMTIERGDDSDVKETEFVMARRYQLVYAVSQDLGTPNTLALTMDYFGRQNTDASFTPAIAIPSVNTINSKLTQMFKDSAWAGVGGTVLSGIFRGATIDIVTGVHPKTAGGTTKTFDTVGEGDISVTSTFVFESTAAAVAIDAEFAAGTFAAIELNTNGPQIAAGDTHNLTIRVGGFWTVVTQLATLSEGNNLYAATHMSNYDLTGAKSLEVEVTTDVAAI